MAADEHKGQAGRSSWAIPLGLVMLVAGAVGAWLLPNDEATTFTGILVAVAVAGAVLALGGLWTLRNPPRP